MSLIVSSYYMSHMMWPEDSCYLFDKLYFHKSCLIRENVISINVLELGPKIGLNIVTLALVEKQ